MLESRSFARAEMDVPVTVTGSSGASLPCRMLNASDGGILLMSLAEMTIGEEFSVTIKRDAGKSLELRGKVVRVAREELARGTMYRVGGAWGELSTVQRASLQRFVDKNLSIFWDKSNATLPQQVATHFIPIVKRLAQSIAMKLPRHVTVDDLVGAGFVALVEHYGKNCELPEEEFERSALSRIRGAMLDELRLSDPLTRRMRQRERQIESASRSLEGTLGRAPSDDEVAKHLGIEVGAYRTALRAVAASRSCSLEPHHANYVADQQGPTPEESYDRAESIDQLRTAMNALPERLRRVLELHYGNDLTLREVGNIIGVTEARVCQLVGAAVIRLRDECFRDVGVNKTKTARTTRAPRRALRKVA